MKYTETHEWVSEDGKVGITPHAQKELGDIVYVELPKVGSIVKIGDQVAVLESTKAAVDVYSPVGGKILEVNEKLKEDSGLINTSPENEGWIFKIQFENTEGLMDKDQYLQMIK